MWVHERHTEHVQAMDPISRSLIVKYLFLRSPLREIVSEPFIFCNILNDSIFGYCISKSYHALTFSTLTFVNLRSTTVNCNRVDCKR